MIGEEIEVLYEVDSTNEFSRRITNHSMTVLS